ncbi:four helix bundle protein [Geomonas propionica]|uniref:Four helix bundle protein n=1 Tax=Geomonas propionica TaxID=2798582 RepID=A0ABS0YUW7_9BACT|nr:four helix bundle protein [Geomonas propionica]MBJ6801714.1 four helix bundle protein [Geomonas propionica]
MRIQRFEDVDSWKEARLLVSEIYRHVGGCRDYGFRDQIQRDAVSVMSNIAEGFDRGSNKEFVQYLIISRGSLSEVKSLTYAGLDIGYLDQKDFEAVMVRCNRISNILNGFIRFLKSSQRKA